MFLSLFPNYSPKSMLRSSFLHHLRDQSLSLGICMARQNNVIDEKETSSQRGPSAKRKLSVRTSEYLPQ